MTNKFRLELFTKTHDVSEFSSGESDLDVWLRTSALTAQMRGTSRTFVWIETATEQIVGYYSLAAHVIEREHLSKKLAHGLPRQVAAVLLGRLAVDQHWQGQGIGAALLAHAVKAATEISARLGARYLVVDALHPRAAAFYERYGFTPVPDQSSLRLAMRLHPDLFEGLA